jgi:demethylmenaquinone methyltransferase/2-methoxy-6-polyprenyl-1,4-benzoquinol methylase/phosphoethanolamine N-methyltransferase
MKYKFAPAFISENLAHMYDFAVNIVGVGDSLHRRIIDISNLKGNEHVLDIGAGSGTLVTKLKKQYPNLTVSAVDPDENILQIAKRKAAKEQSDIDFQVAFAEKLPFEDKSFDVIYSTLTFHHMPLEIKKLALKEIKRVLKPGGTFFLIDIGAPKNLLWNILLRIESIVEKKAYIKDNLAGMIPRLLHEADFHVHEAREPYIGNRFLVNSVKR